MRVTLALCEEALLDCANIAVGVDERFLEFLDLPSRTYGRLSLANGRVVRVVQLLPLKGREEGVVYLSPLLALSFDRSLLLRRFLRREWPRVEGELTLAAATPQKCPVSRLKLQRIGLPTPEYDIRSAKTELESLTESVRQYFRTSRKYVAVGDLVPLVLRRGDREERRYYKVLSIEPEISDCAHFVDLTTSHVSLKAGFERDRPLSHFLQGGTCGGFLLPEPVKEDEVLPNLGPLLPHWKKIAKNVAPLLVRSRRLSFRWGLLLSGTCGRTVAITHAARALGMKVVWVECSDLPVAQVGDVCQMLKAVKKEALKFAPCFVVLRDLELLLKPLLSENKEQGDASLQTAVSAVLHELTQQPLEDPGNSVFLVGVCDSPRSLTAAVRHVFTHELQIGPVEGKWKTALLRFEFDRLHLFEGLAEAALDLVSEALLSPSPRDITALCYRLFAAYSGPPQAGAVLRPGERGELPLEEVEEILTAFQKRPGAQKNIAEVPKVEWDDIGGLEDVKALIKETVELPIKHRSLFTTGLHKRVGVLLHGLPGVGKTLLAKAIATECKTRFMSIKGPELLNMYVGETERLIRDLFERAKSASPCVLFFDELDALAPARGGQESKSAMDCVVSQFFAELDGVSFGQYDVFVFGATNRLDLIDPALLRPGRLDKLVEVGPPQSVEAKFNVLRSLTRRFTLSHDVDLMRVAENVRTEASGADLYAVCALAWTKACKRHIAAAEGQAQVEVEQQDFLEAL